MIIKPKNQIAATILLSIALNLTGQYHSQVGQDRWINENIFNNIPHLTFVDVGAANGIEISDTLFFEEELTWNGICIESLLEKYAELKITGHAIMNLPV